jgi:anti-sigma factor RsiW
MQPSSEHCIWTLERIDRFIDGELQDVELERFEGHVVSCERCREELRRAEALVDELRALPAYRCPERVLERAEAEAWAHGAAVSRPTALERMRERVARFGTSYVLRPGAVMGAVLIVAVAAAFVVRNHERLRIGRFANQPPERVVSDKELQEAQDDVALAFSYVDKYTTDVAENAVRRDVGDRVLKTLCESVVKPITPFPFRK